MCDTSPSESSINRRSLLGAALAGTGVAVAGSLAGPWTPKAEAITLGTPLRPILPVLPSQPKGPLLTLLGTSGGPQAEYVRTGTSSVLTVNGWNYVVDMGRSSVTQYLNSGLRFDHLRGMFVTHMHADHLADYYNYLLLEGGKSNAEKDMLAGPPTVFGPGPGVLPPLPAGVTAVIAPDYPNPGIKDLTTRLNEGYAYSYNIFLRDDGTSSILNFQTNINEIVLPKNVEARVNPPTITAPDMEPFQIYQDENVRVSTILVPHGKLFPAYAYRFDLMNGRGSVVFSGDTAESNNVVKLAQGANLLVHEVMDYDFIKTFGGGLDPTELSHLLASHTTTEQVGRVAQAAGVSKLVLTHLIPSNPLYIPDLVWKVKCSVGYRGSVHVGNDLDQIPLPIRP